MDNKIQKLSHKDLVPSREDAASNAELVIGPEPERLDDLMASYIEESYLDTDSLNKRKDLLAIRAERSSKAHAASGGNPTHALAEIDPEETLLENEFQYLKTEVLKRAKEVLYLCYGAVKFFSTCLPEEEQVGHLAKLLFALKDNLDGDDQKQIMVQVKKTCQILFDLTENKYKGNESKARLLRTAASIAKMGPFKYLDQLKFSDLCQNSTNDLRQQEQVKLVKNLVDSIKMELYEQGRGGKRESFDIKGQKDPEKMVKEWHRLASGAVGAVLAEQGVNIQLESDAEELNTDFGAFNKNHSHYKIRGIYMD